MNSTGGSDPGSSASSPDSSNSSLTELKAVIIERDPQSQELPNPSQPVVVELRRRKRRSERFSDLLNNERASNGKGCSMVPVKKGSKFNESLRYNPMKKEQTFLSTVVGREEGRIPGLSNDSLLDRLKFRNVKKMENSKSKNKGFLSKTIIEALNDPSRVLPLKTDIDRSLPAIPSIRKNSET